MPAKRINIPKFEILEYEIRCITLVRENDKLRKIKGDLVSVPYDEVTTYIEKCEAEIAAVNQVQK